MTIQLNQPRAGWSRSSRKSISPAPTFQVRRELGLSISRHNSWRIADTQELIALLEPQAVERPARAYEPGAVHDQSLNEWEASVKDGGEKSPAQVTNLMTVRVPTDCGTFRETSMSLVATGGPAQPFMNSSDLRPD